MIGDILPRERQFLSYHVGGAKSSAPPLQNTEISHQYVGQLLEKERIQN